MPVVVHDVPSGEVRIGPPATTNVLFPYDTPYRSLDVPEVLAVQDMPSGEERIVPASPTATYVPFPYPTPERVEVTPEVLAVQEVPSGEERIIPLLPTLTNRLGEVVKPLDESYWLLKVLSELSFTPVVTRILYVVKLEISEDGVTEKVLLELDTVGESLICTHVLKLSEDT